MSGFSFNNVQEVKQSVGTKVSTGIHEFKILEPTIEDVKGKDGNPDWKKGVVVFECTKSNIAKDLDYSIGKTINYDIMFPRDAEGAEKLGKRLIHIFSKIATKEKIETVKEAIQKLDLSSIETLMKGLSKIIIGRNIRLKIVATQDGKYPTIPLYYAGYAETIDTVPTQLVYDEEKEGVKTQPRGAENAKTTSEESPVASGSDIGDLPF